MIDLKKDMFSHLAISANKLKNLKITKIANSGFNYREKTKSAQINLIKPLEITKPQNKNIQIERKIEEKLEEKVSQFDDFSKLNSLKEDLENVEVIFKKLKGNVNNKELLWKLENKIIELKKIIEEKSNK